MKPLEIREIKSGEISINGLSAIEVISVKEVINYLAEGIKVNRVSFRIERLAPHLLTLKVQGHTLFSM